MESVTKAQIRGISDIDDDEELPPQNLNQPKNHNSDQYSFQSEFFKGKSIQDEQVVCIEEETSSENYSENDVDEIQLTNEFLKEHKGMEKNEDLNKTTKYEINSNNEATNDSLKNQDEHSNNLCIKYDQIDEENQNSSNKTNDDIPDFQTIKILFNVNDYNKLSDDEFNEFQTNQTKNDQVLFCFEINLNNDQFELQNIHVIDDNFDSEMQNDFSIKNGGHENDSPYSNQDGSDFENQNSLSLMNDEQENDSSHLNKDDFESIIHSDFSLMNDEQDKSPFYSSIDDSSQQKVIFDVNYNFDKVTESIQNAINNQNGIIGHDTSSHDNNDLSEPNKILLIEDKKQKIFEINFNFSKVNELIQKLNQ